MPVANNPKHILKTALGAVMRQTGLVLDIDNKAPGKQFLLLKTPKATVKLELLVVEGGAIAVSAAHRLNRLIKNPPRCVMIIPQVTAEMADRLRDDDTQFMDTAGNC